MIYYYLNKFFSNYIQPVCNHLYILVQNVKIVVRIDIKIEPLNPAILILKDTKIIATIHKNITIDSQDIQKHAHQTHTDHHKPISPD